MQPIYRPKAPTFPLFQLRCVNCSRRTESDELDPRCPGCHSALLLLDEGKKTLSRREIESLPPGVWRFRSVLPTVAYEHIVSLGEGGTPLITSKRLGEELGLRNLLIKDETRNPTGSFIDRGSTVLVSLAKERGINNMLCTTTGNLGASLAAYCAKAGIQAEIKIHPKTDHGKLYQMIAYGARVEILSRMTDKDDSGSEGVRVSAENPFVLEGEKTTGFEIVQEMGWKQPRAVVLPVGTGGHLAMTWRSLQELRDAGLIDDVTCRLIGVQLRSSAPIVEDLQPMKQFEPADESITELEESEPIFKKAAVRAMRESNGLGVEVSAKEAIEATSLLARTEGIFAEPASASVIASLRIMRNDGRLDRDDKIVCVITGAGLKNTMVVKRIARTPKHVVSREEPLFRPLQVGPTKVRIMEALAAKPEFGYGLWKILKDRGEISTASVYQHLSELEGIGIVRRSRVTTAHGRERIYYELTRKGTELLNTVGSPGRKNGFVMV